MGNRNQYVYGSAAPQMPQKQEQSGSVRKEKQVRTPHTAPVYANVPKAKLFFGVIVILVVCFIILNRFSVLAEMNYKLGAMTSRHNQLRDENRRLRVEIESNINLERVRQIAQEDLGMHKPDRFQVIPISVPKNNYSVVLDEQYIQEAESTGNSIIENAINAVKALFP